MRVLVLADHENGQLQATTAHVVGAASALGADIDVLVAGGKIQKVARKAAAISGISLVYTADSPAYQSQSIDALTHLLESMSSNYTHILASTTALGRVAIPNLAAALHVNPLSDVIRIHGPHRFDRPSVFGNMVQTIETGEDKTLMTVRPSAFTPVRFNGREAPIQPANTFSIETVADYLSAFKRGDGTTDLTKARIVVGGGNAFESQKDFARLRRLAEVLGAALGASREAVQAGFAAPDREIGSGASIIAPDVYVGVGVTGSLQHLAGIQGARRIVAIHSRQDEPFMRLADMALIGDPAEVVPRLAAGIVVRYRAAQYPRAPKTARAGTGSSKPASAPLAKPKTAASPASAEGGDSVKKAPGGSKAVPASHD